MIYKHLAAGIDKTNHCDKGHDPIFYSGDKCPMCTQLAAATVIAREYIRMAEMCGRLIQRLRGSPTPRQKTRSGASAI